jgi:hypothetical protein
MKVKYLNSGDNAVSITATSITPIDGGNKIVIEYPNSNNINTTLIIEFRKVLNIAKVE